ncbi:MAG TPA: DNA translocase FtsK, partial [Bellilinea sp.]|nr:DNA translocase FtsK [Bellilinea sp.]
MRNSKTEGTRKRRPTQPALPTEQESKPSIFNDVADFLERYGLEILGVGLILGSLLSFLALIGLSRGSFISPWGELLRQWFGVGTYIFVPTVGLIGLLILLKKSGKTIELNLKQVLAGEGLVFAVMIFLALFSKLSVSRAEAGLDGGMVGWGLAAMINKVLPHPWALVLMIPVIGLLIYLTLGLSGEKVESLRSTFRGLLKKVPMLEPAKKDHNTNPVAISRPEVPAADVQLEEPVSIKPSIKNEARKVVLPDYGLLLKDEITGVSEERIIALAQKVEQTLDEFGIPSKVIGYRVGPTVTQFAVEPGYVTRVGPDGEEQQQKIRVSQISNLSRDLALALSAERLRIEAPVPGHSYVGIEIPNASTQMVRLRSILESPEYRKIKSPLALALGRDVSGA